MTSSLEEVVQICIIIIAWMFWGRSVLFWVMFSSVYVNVLLFDSRNNYASWFNYGGVKMYSIHAQGLVLFEIICTFRDCRNLSRWLFLKNCVKIDLSKLPDKLHWALPVRRTNFGDLETLSVFLPESTRENKFFLLFLNANQLRIFSFFVLGSGCCCHCVFVHDLRFTYRN